MPLDSPWVALTERSANKGVFITASGYTGEAVEFGKQVSDGIVLVDGQRLTALMIEHGVGVSHKIVKLPRVDYFEEE
ncbi:restriction endonuclease [Myxococcota bacterium]